MGASDRGCDTPGLGYWLGEADIQGQGRPPEATKGPVHWLVSLHGGNILMQPLYEKMPSQGEKFRDAPQ